MFIKYTQNIIETEGNEVNIKVSEEKLILLELFVIEI